MLLSEKDIQQRLLHLEGWSYEDGHLIASYKLEDFKEAFSLMTRIAFEAESMDHHPDWSNSYNKLDIQLTTHEKGGVTEKDFKLATIISNIV